MSKVILNIAVSLDGFIAREDENDLSWLHDAMAPKEDYGMCEFFKNLGAVIVGGRTYQMALARDGRWPGSKKTPSYVVTRTPPAPASPRITGLEFHSGDLAALVRAVKKKTDKDVWLMGGGLLTQGFLREGLLNEIALSLIPILLGGGVPLFGRIGKETKLRLAHSKAHPSGIVQLRYVVK